MEEIVITGYLMLEAKLIFNIQNLKEDASFYLSSISKFYLDRVASQILIVIGWRIGS